MRLLFRTSLFIKNLSLGVVLSISFSTCIEPLELEANQEFFSLIVDGFITNEEGPHRIRLTEVGNFAPLQNGGLNRWEENAQVYITDQNGNVTTLVEEEFGFYATPDEFKAELGNSYTLEIIRSHGERFLSSAETLPKDGPDIDSLLMSFKKLPSSDPVTFESGIEIFSRFQDPAGELNFYLWTINREIFQANGCFFSKPIEQLKTISDASQDGEIITERIMFLRDDGMRFQTKIHVDVSQYSVSSEAFEFHRLVESQLSVEGDIFDPPVGIISGNIIRDSSQGPIPDPDHPGEILQADPDELVFGYFGVYNVAKKGSFIPLDILEERQRDAGGSVNPCDRRLFAIERPPDFFLTGG